MFVYETVDRINWLKKFYLLENCTIKIIEQSPSVERFYCCHEISKLQNGSTHCRLCSQLHIQGGPKKYPLQNYQKIVINPIEVCKWN